MWNSTVKDPPAARYAVVSLKAQILALYSFSSYVRQWFAQGFSDWFAANKLSLDGTKTNFMVFRPWQKKFLMGKKEITWVSGTLFLGVLLDECLSWKSHISQVPHKIFESIGIIFKSSFFLSKVSLRTLYDSMILDPQTNSIDTVPEKVVLRWLKPVSTLERNVLIRRIETKTLYHLTAILWYHIKHQLFLKKIWSFLWRKKLPWQQKNLAKTLHSYIASAALISKTKSSVTRIFYSVWNVISMPEWNFLQSLKKLCAEDSEPF